MEMSFKTIAKLVHESKVRQREVWLGRLLDNNGEYPRELGASHFEQAVFPLTKVLDTVTEMARFSNKGFQHLVDFACNSGVFGHTDYLSASA
jgi:hypothetical protein